jgi:hypothetical protein
MRENPWHLRLPTTEHYQWYKNLVDLHDMTSTWLKESDMNKPSYILTRGVESEVSENLWMLDFLFDNEIEKFLDDTSPVDLLRRLEHTIWAVQASTLIHLQSKSNLNRDALDSLLEQASWKLGRKCGEKRWEKLIRKGDQELRAILLALNDSPFSGYPHQPGFLVRRAISTEIQIELRACPHQIQYAEIQPVADRLCRLHSQWMRGFAYSLNNRTTVEHLVQSPRCAQRWFFV